MQRLRASDIRLQRGGRDILSEVSVDAGPSEVLVLVGPSGAGKTSLLRVLLGLERPDDGEVFYGETRLQRMGGRARAAALGWLPQVGPIVEALACREFVAAARYRFDEGRADSLRAASMALAHCGIERLADQPINTVSGGEYQRVALAALVAQDPEFLLLDEPSNHLDLRRQRELVELLGREWHGGRGLLMITHDVNLLHALGIDPSHIRLLGLKAGRAVMNTTLDAPDLPERLSELLDLPMRSLNVDGHRHLIPAAS